MTKETGGPAFSVPHNYIDRFGTGMTLRDYFAAKAMQGFCAVAETEDDVDLIPEVAYAMADAMLEAREQ